MHPKVGQPPFVELPYIERPASLETLDPAGYLRANPDVAIVGMSARDHFEAHGRREGRFQIVNEEAIVRLRSRKLAALKFIRAPFRPNPEGGAMNFISADQAREFGIPDAPPVSSHNYSEDIMQLIRGNPDKLFLDIGSGLRPTYFSNVVNTEIYRSVTADVLCVGEDLPFEDEQFDYVFAFAVLEHTRRPWDVAAEMIRVLKPGGFLHVDYPHLAPVHGYPHHYFNATPQGSRSLFEHACDIRSIAPHPAQIPLYALRWILGIWRDALPPEAAARFNSWTVGQILDEPPDVQTGLPQVSGLDMETQMMISAGTYLIAQKRAQRVVYFVASS